MNKIKNWRRTILCTQCDKNELQVNGKIKALNVREEKISMLQLLLATSSGLLTRSNCISDKTLLLARSYLPIIQFWMNENKDGGLILDADSSKVLRDFSRTSRCGEIAQGINYIIAKRLMRSSSGAWVNAIYDYDDYIESQCAISSKYSGRKPDYVLVYQDGTVGVLESKGSLGNEKISSMRSGLEQCKNGAKFLNDHKIACCNSYVGLVLMAQNKKRDCVNAYFADPINGHTYQYVIPQNAWMYEYAKFFYLAGDYNAAESLIRGEVLSDNIQRPTLEMLCATNDSPINWSMQFERNSSFLQKKDYIIGQWDVVTGMHGEITKIVMGVTENTMKILRGIPEKIEDNAELQNKYELDYIENNSDSIYTEYGELFPDGTFLFIVYMLNLLTRC